jgi:hypothetical protein
VIDRYCVSAGAAEQPTSQRTLYVDGSPGSGFRPEQDLELSHWVPNRTPDRYKADTSTEICLNFAQDPPEGDFDLVVNNHVDVDGILSVFALVHSELAREHRKVLVGAAEMGDFSACAPRLAQAVFQGLTLIMEDADAEGLSPPDTYARAFAALPRWLAKGVDDPRIAAGLDALDRSIERIECNEVMVAEATDRLTLFYLPELEDDGLPSALKVPAFNALLDDSCYLWPQARNRFDGEQVHLVSTPHEGGFFHDLWYPGYMWAETPNRWRAPGFERREATNSYALVLPELEEATGKLQERDTSDRGRWVLASEVSPFSSLPGRGFPVILSFLDADGRPATSSLDSTQVADQLVSIFP